MPRMLELIRTSQVPANLMQSAARGALSVSPEENIEILVYLAVHHKLFGPQARLTLAGWDEKASIVVAADPRTSAEVLGYLVSPENLRVPLLPALAGNLSVSDEALEGLAVSGSRSVVETLLTSPRMMSSSRLLQALQSNPNLRPTELAEIVNKLGALEPGPAIQESETDAGAPDEIVESAVAKYLQDNAAELAAEKEKVFQATGVGIDDLPVEGKSENDAVSPTAEAVGREAAKPPTDDAATAVSLKAKKPVLPSHDDKRDSVLQKIAKLNITGRIALAMRGDKEERSILIRDSTKLVCLAVLDSPKVSDGEVERFALQKNVLEAVLRGIPMRRKYAKNYAIMRNLVFNPRTPLDLSLGLMKNLLVHDLKNLSGNKEVSDTVRKLALRMFKQKMEKK